MRNNSLTPGELANLKAAYADDPKAMTEVGKVFQTNGNEEEALDWLFKAAMQIMCPRWRRPLKSSTLAASMPPPRTGA